MSMIEAWLVRSGVRYVLREFDLWHALEAADFVARRLKSHEAIFVAFLSFMAGHELVVSGWQFVARFAIYFVFFLVDALVAFAVYDGLCLFVDFILKSCADTDDTGDGVADFFGVY